MKTEFVDDMMRTVRIWGIAKTIAACSIILPLAAGCVSLSLAPQTAEKSAGVKFDSPSEPFSQIRSTRADGAWRNSVNGNTISYLSTCNDSADSSLDSATQEMISELEQTQQIRSSRLPFNGREALDTEVDGRVEGVPTRMRVIVFKRNGCLFNINYIGLSSSFDDNRSHFDSFLKGFRAP
jgi:hypothetical protein